MAPVVTSISLSSSKIQNGDILVPANSGPPGKMAIKPDRVIEMSNGSKINEARLVLLFVVFFYFSFIFTCILHTVAVIKYSCINTAFRIAEMG